MLKNVLENHIIEIIKIVFIVALFLICLFKFPISGIIEFLAYLVAIVYCVNYCFDLIWDEEEKYVE